VNDDFMGYGRMEYINGVVYEGDWKDSCYCGKGAFTSLEGHRFTGQFVQNAFNGHGTMEYPNGDVYEGEWRDDVKWGSGRMRFGNGRADQIGTWERGVFHEGTDYVLPQGCPRKAARFFGEERQLDSWAGPGGSSQRGEESVETKYSHAIDVWEATAQDRLQSRERTQRIYYGPLHAQHEQDRCGGQLPAHCPPKAAKSLGLRDDAKLPSDRPQKAADFLGHAASPGPAARSLRPSTRHETEAAENATECFAGSSASLNGDDFFYAEAGAGKEMKKFGGLGSPSIEADERKVNVTSRMSYEVGTCVCGAVVAVRVRPLHCVLTYSLSTLNSQQAKETIRRLGETSNV